MGFLKKILKPVAAIAAPVLGAKFGPVGAAIGGVISEAVSKPKVPPPEQSGGLPMLPAALTSAPAMSMGGGMMTVGASGAAVAGAGSIPRVVGAAIGSARRWAAEALRMGKAGVHAGATGMAYLSAPILGKVLTGRQVARFARKWGVPATAAALGVSDAVIHWTLARNELAPQRRRRGWSARDSRQYTKLTRRACSIAATIERARAAGTRTRSRRKC